VYRVYTSWLPAYSVCFHMLLCWSALTVQLVLVVTCLIKKGKGFPYLLPSIGPGADPSVQAVSPQVTISHPPGSGLPLLVARLAVTFPSTEHHRPLAGTKLYCLVTEAHRCEQLAKGYYAALPQVGFEPTTCIASLRCTCLATMPPTCLIACHISLLWTVFRSSLPAKFHLVWFLSAEQTV